MVMNVFSMDSCIKHHLQTRKTGFEIKFYSYLEVLKEEEGGGGEANIQFLSQNCTKIPFPSLCNFCLNPGPISIYLFVIPVAIFQIPFFSVINRQTQFPFYAS